MPKENERVREKHNSEIRNQVEEKKQRNELQRKKQDLDDKVAKVSEKAKQYMQLYGEEDQRTEFMMGILESMLAMQDFIEQMTALSLALESIKEVVKIADSVTEMDSLFNVVAVSRQPSFIQRIKKKLEIRRAVGGIKAKIDNALYMMKAQQELVDVINDAMRSATKGLNSGKKKKKKNHDNDDYYQRAKALISKDESGDNASTGAGSANGSGTAAASSAGGSGTAKPSSSDKSDDKVFDL